MYGLGNFGKGFFYYSLGAYLAFFYVDVLSLDPGLMALALAVPYGVWNAVNDPLVGMISDRLKTPWGRRVPLIAVGAPLTALLFWLIWSPRVVLGDASSSSLFIFLMVTLALFDFALTAVTAGYEALFPELFDDLSSRSEASLYRELFALLGVVAGFAVFPLLRSALSPFVGALEAWSYSALILSAASLASILASLIACRERAGASAAQMQPGLLESLKLTLTNRAYLAFLGANVVVFFLWSWIPSMIPFYVKYVLRAGDEVNALILGSMLLSAVAWWPVMRRILLRVGSKTSFTLSAVLFVLALQPLLLASSAEQVAALMVLVGAGNAGLQLVRMLLLSNVVDQEWVEKGYRREGTYIGTMIFFERLMYIVQGALLAALLGSIGYAPDAPPTPLLTFGVRASVTLIPLACLIPLLASLAFYPIGKREEELITKASRELWLKKQVTSQR
ncbi:MAG: MFS transporter [Thermofilum sp.]